MPGEIRIVKYEKGEHVTLCIKYTALQALVCGRHLLDDVTET